MKLTSFSVRLLSAATLTSLLLACNRNTDPQPAASLYTDGVFVLNSGNFLDNNGTLSWLPRTGSTAQNNLFQVRNGRPLTGGVLGYVEAGNRGLILVDNSTAGADKVEIVTADSLRSVKTLASPDIENPRAAARVSDTKVYVTCWGTTGSSPFYVNPGYIAVVDLTSNTVTKRITLQKGAEGVTVVGNEAYVTGQGGERIIQVIDTQTDAVKTSIAVPGSISPLVVDATGKLWGTQGKNVVRIDPATKAIEATIPVGTSTSSSAPSGLVASADGRSLYYKYTSDDASFRPVGQVYRFAITDATITPTTPVFNRTFTGLTGLGFDTKSNVVYAGVAPSYKQAGYVYRYQASGQLIDSVRVEIGPTAFFVK